jgi:hypothetical protein
LKICPKRESQIIKIRALKKRKRKEMKEEPNLMANGRFQAWWPLESSKFGSQWGSILFGGQWKVSMFDGPWKVPSLVTFGRKRRSIIFTFFHFPRNKFYLNLFSIDFKILLYHGFRSLLYTFP